MDSLQPGQCTSLPVQVSAYVPQTGVWYLGAIADVGHYQPELSESNNASEAGLLFVTP